jgi:hypothetical protein
MRNWIISFGLTLTAASASALDICPIYRAVHDREIIARIRGGVPFKLLSVAEAEKIYKRIVRVEFDLWTEIVTVELAGGKSESAAIKDAFALICRNISFPEIPIGQKSAYHLLLNPILGDGLKRLHRDDKSERFLKVNWEMLENELQSEKTLINAENLK